MWNTEIAKYWTYFWWLNTIFPLKMFCTTLSTCRLGSLSGRSAHLLVQGQACSSLDSQCLQQYWRHVQREQIHPEQSDTAEPWLSCVEAQLPAALRNWEALAVTLPSSCTFVLPPLLCLLSDCLLWILSPLHYPEAKFFLGGGYWKESK